MRGRKPVPTNLKIFRGNPGRHPLNKLEPKGKTKIPPCPPVIKADDEARKEWRRMSRELKVLGLVTLIDRAALSAYCLLWSRWIDAETKVREKGSVVRGTHNDPVMNPYLRVASKALEQMKAMLVEFGMTPSSRSRIAANPVADDDEDEKFFKLPS
jgi:P27 family predicted phage terminase small subunit